MIAALQVVIVEKRHQSVGVAITASERVVVVEHAQRLIVVQARPREPVLRALVIDQRRAQRRAQWEIEDGIEVMVVLILKELGHVLPALEQHFADEPQLRMLAADLRLEVVPELRLDVLDRIHADVGHLTVGDPVLDVVDEEVEHLRVVVIEVRQPRELALDVARAADVEESGWKPVLGTVARMIDDHVEHDFDACCRARIHELAERAPVRRKRQARAVQEARVDALEILRPIVVVWLGGLETLDVRVDRRHPDRGYAELGEVIELLQDAIERAAVDEVVCGIGRALVGAEEPIGDDEIDDIVLRDGAVHDVCLGVRG